jgi:predicted AAA+ superfamily ATPase
MKVTVVRNDENYGVLLEYLHHHTPMEYSRELLCIENKKPRYVVSEPDFVWNGIHFKIVKNEVYRKTYEFYKYSELHIIHDSLTIITTFISNARIFITDKLYNKGLCVYKSDYSEWELQNELKERNMDSIYLPQKIKESLLQDIDTFLSKPVVERYTQLKVNHTRLYMLYGPPGTGKTSLIKGVATYLRKNITYLSIPRDIRDSQLLKCIQNVPANSILCLEDIDALFGEDRTSKTGLSFSGFINIFDGFSTPDNLLVFITTNKLEQLENAVVRRISYFIEFKYADKEQIKSMFETFFPNYISQFEDFYCNINVEVTINVLEKFFVKYLFDDIIKESKNFSKFANGELKIELNNKYLYT